MEWDPDEPSPATVADFALMEAEAGALDRYWRLAVETSRYQKRLKAEGHLQFTSWIGVSEAELSAPNLIQRIAPEHRDEQLFARWAAWHREYEQIHAASPKWRLRKMISAVSETHHCLSWPNRWERDIWQWAMMESVDPACPFCDRNQIFDDGFRGRMRALIQECNGFLYRCEESGQVVFAPMEALPRIWAHQDHLAAIDRAKPFGFFHDMSRPDHRDHARDLTPFEEQVLSTIKERRRPRLRPRLRDFARRLRRFF
jgi:hypothetical protein